MKFVTYHYRGFGAPPKSETRTHDWFPYGSFLQIKPDSYSYAQTQQTSESEFDYNSEKE